VSVTEEKKWVRGIHIGHNISRLKVCSADDVDLPRAGLGFVDNRSAKLSTGGYITVCCLLKPFSVFNVIDVNVVPCILNC
jgi:hypothetical protein